MASRETFLARVRAAQPAAEPLPEVPGFDAPPGDVRERFVASLALMGGKTAQVASGGEVLAQIQARFGADVSIVSSAPE
ncbi:MAG: hypothetical protein V4793_30620, partial [Paraburkholderia tropica]